MLLDKHTPIKKQKKKLVRKDINRVKKYTSVSRQAFINHIELGQTFTIPSNLCKIHLMFPKNIDK